ncbi:unnamed protein product [Rhizoctonia solani]|uniref:VWFA domain-containing protein n=1 Tax=Rhizoctonia solani TaxID=456999 RepID=A0A8H3BFS7_9AGAM|nr:unnamed protein product [Rhizoctonia solani]
MKVMKIPLMNFKVEGLAQEMKAPQCCVTWCARLKAVMHILISVVIREAAQTRTVSIYRSACTRIPIDRRTGYPMAHFGHEVASKVCNRTGAMESNYQTDPLPKDPYSQDEQNEFSKCDVLCAGPEHEATATTAANPSYCTLPMFHAPEPQQPAPLTGHVSRDGHTFDCQNPSRLHQAYHIIFVIDSSGSMTCNDRYPLPNTPISARLTSNCNNRYGAVLSALYGFWLSRDTAAAASTTQARQDAYSVITFDHQCITRLQNDFTSTSDQLIGQLIPQTGQGGTNFQAALAMAQSLIEAHWSSDRSPVIIFLSDGECNIADNPVYDLCHACVRLGKALAFHTVSFGTDTYSASLRRMAEIAHEVYASAPQDVLMAARGNPCAYTNAIDSIQLADTFLGIANSLQKPRASLMNQYGSGGRRAVY